MHVGQVFEKCNADQLVFHIIVIQIEIIINFTKEHIKRQNTTPPEFHI